MKYNSVTCSPDYIPTNQYEISTTSIDDAKRLELFDVIGDLLYGEKVEITYKGIQNKSTVLTFDNMDIDTIKSINYFWIRTQQSKSLFADNDNKIPKDYVLNFICDYFSELSKTYLFMICYIKEINQYKIQFNNEFHSLLSNNIIIGDGKSTCKELIKEKAKGDLIDIDNQLREFTEAVNKLKEILGE